MRPDDVWNQGSLNRALVEPEHGTPAAVHEGPTDLHLTHRVDGARRLTDVGIAKALRDDDGPALVLELTRRVAQSAGYRIPYEYEPSPTAAPAGSRCAECGIGWRTFHGRCVQCGNRTFQAPRD